MTATPTFPRVPRIPTLTTTPSAATPALSWHEVLRDAVRDPRELCHLVGLPDLASGAVAGAADFPVFAPRGYIARMRYGDPRDPLLRQVLPLDDERRPRDGFTTDPVGDLASARSPGLLAKYAGRVLMVATGTCAVHCRYCFRRHFPYESGALAAEALDTTLAAIAADTSIQEVILSGGDPLTLVDRQLAELADRLAGISHVRRLRVHTRLPIVIPERVTDALIGWLRGSRLVPIVVLHANHAAELDEHVGAATGRLVDAGIPLLNQAVLLRGVNDSVEALTQLSVRLVDLRIMPYYLHQLDRVAGAAHFEVPETTGRDLVAQLRERLPGYAVPRYVREVAGGLSKQPIE